MSTPEGSWRRISASTVFEVGSRMPIRRLCVRISNCSRDSLSMCGERITQNFSSLVLVCGHFAYEPPLYLLDFLEPTDAAVPRVGPVAAGSRPPPASECGSWLVSYLRTVSRPATANAGVFEIKPKRPRP